MGAKAWVEAVVDLPNCDCAGLRGLQRIQNVGAPQEMDVMDVEKSLTGAGEEAGLVPRVDKLAYHNRDILAVL